MIYRMKEGDTYRWGLNIGPKSRHRSIALRLPFLTIRTAPWGGPNILFSFEVIVFKTWGKL